MKIVFWGTPLYAVDSLEELINSGQEIVGVVTQPDKRRKRGKTLYPSPVKEKAMEYSLNIFTPENIKNDTYIQEEIISLQADIFVVVAYGQLLPKNILDAPRLGCWNSHASLLPQWRGAAPIQRSLINGDKSTGICIMLMEETLDTGPVLLRESIPIGLFDNSTKITNTLSKLSSQMILRLIHLLNTKKVKYLDDLIQLDILDSQNDSELECSYARMISKKDYEIDWSNYCINLHRKIMGLYPNAYTHLATKRLKVYSTLPLNPNSRDELPEKQKDLLEMYTISSHKPGTIISIINKNGIIIATGDYPLLILSAKLEGGKVLTGQALTQKIMSLQLTSLGDNC